ncbi:hypothetical protein E2C01_022189 [Portunus trituberculatus]|uniref:Uncharacterized protein n=1 Tax=Portunus trituberculatus TaxID=210409 RepID=A0A5B7E885_PORTR|nr:hypothetical protein [Portunus trituberculatus]
MLNISPNCTARKADACKEESQRYNIHAQKAPWKHTVTGTQNTAYSTGSTQTRSATSVLS